jgi:hypothetical protein
VLTKIRETLARPRARKAAIATGAMLALWALVGFLVLPAVLRPIVERKIGEALHRKARLHGLSINPFTLSATLTGLDVKDRDGGPFLSFETLYGNAEVSSVLRGGPVLRAITLVKPSVTLVRNADGTYSVQDLIEEFSKPKPKDERPFRFSLNNIHVEGGSVDFDDRPKKTAHAVRDIRIGIPLLSNIPSKVEITTEPVFEAKVNGAPFALRGTTKPFSETRETTVDLNLEDVDLPFYLAYVPAKTRPKLTSARLDAKLAFSFHQPRAGPPALVVSGTVGLRKVVLGFSSRPAFDVVLSEATVSLEGLSTEPGRPAALVASARTDAGETFKNTGTVSMEPLALEGTLSVDGVPLKRYTALLDEFAPIAMDDGVLALETRYRYATGKDANTTLSGLSVEVKTPRLRKKGEKEPFFKAESLSIADTSLDLAKHEFVLGRLESAGGTLAVVREKDGNADLLKLVPRPAPGAPPAPSAPWDVILKKIALRGYTVKMDDRSLSRPARYALTKTELVLEDISTAKGSKGSLAVRFGVDGKGTASTKGAIGFQPMFADLRVDVDGVDLVPIEAYVLQDLRLDLAKGAVSAGGTLAIREDASGKASVVYAGNTVVADVLALDQSSQREFVKWETLSASGLKAGYNPVFFEAKRVAVAGLGCDITIESDGTLNLRKVTGRPEPADEDESVAAPGAAPAQAPVPAHAPAPMEGGGDAKGAPAVLPVRIDELTLQGGRIGLADHLVKPNYAATLGNLGGRVTGLSSADGTVARLDLRGNLASHSPLEVSGAINPLAAAQFADVKASFRDVDLPSFTPYSGKYAGYAIAGGSLTLEVAYKLENRKLSASNHFLVNQFAFGEKVESKDATKLPVRLAVSLLKDKDGVIDLDLPIEGSLDDPKFRVGRVIWKILGNLIAKAATAPFALLGKLLGGKGEEYASVDFADGVATLDEAARKKLDALGKALHDRPNLKLQAAGRFSGEKDLEGLRSVRVERKLKAQKLSELAKKGGAPASVDDVVVEAAERETYLRKAYRKEKFPKPRNALGIAKDLPPAEMEKLMLANEPAGPDDLRQLALARAGAVKEYLTGPGTVDAARVSVEEPAAEPAAAKDKARPSRVDFALR